MSCIAYPGYLEFSDEQVNKLRECHAEFTKYSNLCGSLHSKQIDKSLMFEDIIGMEYTKLSDEEYSIRTKSKTIVENPYKRMSNFSARIKYWELGIKLIKTDYTKIVKVKTQIEHFKHIVFTYECDDYNSTDLCQQFKLFAPKTPVEFIGIVRKNTETNTETTHIMINLDQYYYWKNLAKGVIERYNSAAKRRRLS